MAYRTRTPDASRFTDRQLTWIRASSSEAEVMANLRGESVAEPASIAPDEDREALFWIGLPFVALAAFAFYETASLLSLLPGGLARCSSRSRSCGRCCTRRSATLSPTSTL